MVELLERHSRKVPCLRKDFMVHPVQVVEAAEAGASAILIIVRALDDGTIRDLQHAAELAGMDSLFEVHNQEELDRALRFNPKMVGVNNRDLRRFVTDLSISESLIPQIPDGVIRVSESGIFTVEDAARVRAAGADAILVGQALMEQDDPTELLESFHSL
ncbi:MAG: Indole-3-glycerol phosphate synthase [Verrucomicrobia bacterium ADurb.Bin474]|nr:MAG: Indole-3-glycerol phosphate synthase [Verrucomicrobia bacterium ADurb.Bin474]